jgi:hypothetical protein
MTYKIAKSVIGRVYLNTQIGRCVRLVIAFIVLTGLARAQVSVTRPIEPPVGFVEDAARRTYNAKVFVGPEGVNQYVISPKQIHYKDAAGQLQDVDLSFNWDPTSRTWSITKASYRLGVPEYADGWLTFTNAHEGRDQTLRTRAVARHVAGSVVETSNTATVVYPDAFGTGRGLVIQANWRGFQRRVVVDTAVQTTSSDEVYNFEMDFPANEAVRVGQDSWNALSDVDVTSRSLSIADGAIRMPVARLWNERGRGLPVPILLENREGTTYLRKSIPAAMLPKRSANPPEFIFADDTYNIYTTSSGSLETDWYVQGWSTARDAEEAYSTGYGSVAVAQDDTAGWFFVSRSFATFDTSSIADGETVTSATMTFNTFYPAYGSGINVTQSQQVDPEELALSDFSLFGADRGFEEDLTDTPEDPVPLYWECLSWINKTGYTKMVFRIAQDIDDNPPPVDTEYMGAVDVDQLVVTTTPPPSKATNPNPANGATTQSITTDLGWSNGGGATSYDVYFGTDPTPDETEFKGNQAGTTYDPGTLAYDTTYYWRIDAKNSGGTTTGDVWNFRTEIQTDVFTAQAAKSGTAIQVVWEDYWPAGADGYKLYRATSGGGPYTALNGDQYIGAPHFKDSGVSYGTTYYYFVRLFKTSGQREQSTTCNAAPGTACETIWPGEWME